MADETKAPFPNSPAPPLRAARLARAIRSYREERGWTISAAAERLGWNRLKIGRQERGDTRPSAHDIVRLADAYDLSDEARVTLLDLVATAETHGWWKAYRDDELMGGNYISYEDEASAIRAWHRGVIPALLQTEDYVRGALQRPIDQTTAARTEQIIQVRMTRKLVLTRPGAPTYHAVIEEAALRRPASPNPRVMAEQIAAILTAAQRDNVTVQVVPISTGTLGVDEAFMLLDFDNDLDLPVVATDGLQHNLIATEREHLDIYTLAWDRINEVTLTPEDSRTFLTDVKREWMNQ